MNTDKTKASIVAQDDNNTSNEKSELQQVSSILLVVVSELSEIKRRQEEIDEKVSIVSQEGDYKVLEEGLISYFGGQANLDKYAKKFLSYVCRKLIFMMPEVRRILWVIFFILVLLIVILCCFGYYLIHNKVLSGFQIFLPEFRNNIISQTTRDILAQTIEKAKTGIWSYWPFSYWK